MSTPRAVPMGWDINGLRLAGLAWGDPGARPLLALHGWLDNAASFAVLAPQLTHHRVVAVDLTGQGRSAHRSADATYQIWDDLPELVGVLESLGWDRFALMGHSRGAIIATLLASAIPERVERLVLLDGLAPAPVAEEEFPRQLRRFLDDRRKWSRRSGKVYPDMGSAFASRDDAAMTAEAQRLLAERGLGRCEGGFTWSSDLRLRGASAVKLTTGQIRAVLGALRMPTLLLLAEQGHAQRGEMATLAAELIADLQVERVGGSHHFHMEPGADKVAARINRFLQRPDRAEGK